MTYRGQQITKTHHIINGKARTFFDVGGSHFYTIEDAQRFIRMLRKG